MVCGAAIWHWYGFHYAFIYFLLFCLLLLFCLFVSVHSSFFFFFLIFFSPSLSGIDKSDESPRYQHVLALCAFFSTSVNITDYFFENFVFDVCVFCFIVVARLILRVLKNLAVS